MERTTELALQAAHESSARTRWVFLLTQIACILIFIAEWNSWQSGWVPNRIRVAEAAAYSFHCSDPPESLTNKEFRTCLEKFGFRDDVVEPAQNFISRYNLTRDGAKDYLRALHNAFVSRILGVSVPFLGFSFDINDLNLFAAITFLVILGWLRFNLRREADNAFLLFNGRTLSTSKADLPAVYHIYSMSHVFIRMNTERNRPEHLWDRIPESFIWAPCAVEALVIVHDFLTLPLGRLLRPSAALGALFFSIIFLVLMFFVSLDCWRIATREFRKELDAAYKQILETTEH